MLWDAHTLVQIILSALLCGLVGLDRTAFAQMMVSQPIVAAPIAGWLLGDTTAGLVIGGTLELIWVLDMPVGTFVPADATIAAVSATAIAAISGGSIPVVGFSLLLTTVMVPATMSADHLMRQRNARIPELALGTDGRPTELRITGWHLAGLFAFFLKSFILCLVIVPCGLIAVSLFALAPEILHRAMAVFVALLPFLGAASAARKLSMSSMDRMLLIGVGIGAVSVQVFHLPVMAAVLLAATAGWAGVRIRGA